MTFPFFWQRRLTTLPAKNRLGRLRKLLSKAGIPYRKDDPESTLSQLEPRTLRQIPLPLTGHELAFPIKPSDRVAVLADGFALPKHARKFDAGESHLLFAYRPQGVVAGVKQARSMASWAHTLPVEDAFVILSSLQDDSLLTDQDRDRFWKIFGTPVFEHLQAWDGTIIARECEVHDGLHVVEGNAILHVCDGELLVTQLNRIDTPVIRVRTQILATLIRDHCECGLETPRLRNLTSIQPQAAAAA